MCLTKLTSKQAIMIPHAGAIFTVRGSAPAYSAAIPSVLTICIMSGNVELDPGAPDIDTACLRVLSTSNGDVSRAAVVPLITPLANATCGPLRPSRANIFFHVSYPAQYTPLNGTSRQSVGPRPRQRYPTPCACMSPRTEASTERRVCGLSGERGVDCKFVRTSSRGDTHELTMVRASMPEKRGTRAGKGRRGGRTLWSK